MDKSVKVKLGKMTQLIFLQFDCIDYVTRIRNSTCDAIELNKNSRTNFVSQNKIDFNYPVFQEDSTLILKYFNINRSIEE